MRRSAMSMLAAGLLVLTGCAEQPPAAAAVVGEQEIALALIDDQLTELAQLLGSAPQSVPADLTRAVVRNNVVYELVMQTAQDAGVTVSQTAIDQSIADRISFAGGQEALEQQAAQAGVAPSLITTDVRVSLLAQEMARAIDPTGVLDPNQVQGTLIGQVQSYSDAAGTTVNPRYGTWDLQSLSILDDPFAPSAPATALGLLEAP